MGKSLRLVVAVVALALFAGLASPAGAVDVPVSGSFTSSGPWSFTCDEAPAPFVVHEFKTGSATWTGLGDVAYEYEFCSTPASPATDPWPVTRGTFTLTTDEGTLTGGISGYMTLRDLGGGLATFDPHLVLTVSGGTGRFASATGEVVLDGTIDEVPGGHHTIDGTVSGSLSIPPPLPTSKDDCKNGGWRDLGDENGEPFRNQGECIAWVKRQPVAG